MTYLPCDSWPDEGPEYTEDDLEDLADRLYDEYQHDERSLASTMAAYRQASRQVRR